VISGRQVFTTAVEAAANEISTSRYHMYKAELMFTIHRNLRCAYWLLLSG